MLNQADSVEMESESMASSMVKATALKAVERREFSGRPPPADLSKVRIAASAAFSSELRSCVMVFCRSAQGW